MLEVKTNSLIIENFNPDITFPILNHDVLKISVQSICLHSFCSV